MCEDLPRAGRRAPLGFYGPLADLNAAALVATGGAAVLIEIIRPGWSWWH